VPTGPWSNGRWATIGGTRRYGNQVLDRPWLRYSVAILLGLSFFYLVVAFGLGAAVTKLKSA